MGAKRNLEALAHTHGCLQCAAMATPPHSANSAYSESSIRVLKGLEPVKQRPGMYTRTDSPLHVLQEVLDNAADESLAGHGKKIKVTVHDDASVSIADDGRGIPFGMHPEENAPVIELVFTQLHAGGKFDKGKGGAYNFSGGLHGVGVSVTNALARRLDVTTYREGQVARMVFSAGDVIEPLHIRPATDGDRKSGTTVRVWPDAKYFDTLVLPMAQLTPPVAQQSGAHARRERHPGARNNQGIANMGFQRRVARLFDANPGRRFHHPCVGR